MRMTLLSLGSTGDVRPYVLLGQELKSRGHEVTVAAFSAFRDMVVDAGLRFFAIAGDAEEFMSNIMKPEAVGVRYLIEAERSIRDIAPVLLRDLLLACEGAEAMVCNFFGTMYYSVAEKYGIPCVQTHFFSMDPTGDMPISSAPGLTWGRWWNRVSYRIGYFLISLLERRYLTAWRRANGMTVKGLRTAPDYRIGENTVPALYAMSPLVVPRPAEWGESIAMTGFWWDDAPCTWQPPEELTAFMAAGDTPVYIGFGSMNSGDMEETYNIVLEAVRLADVRAVINLGWNSDKMHPESDERIFFGDYIPHDWLFDHVCAVVHHGGAGTTAAGLRYGKPTLVIPFGGDQPFWGMRVEALGCGPAPIERMKMTAQRLAEALKELTTNDRYRAAAAALGETMRREHGVQLAADLVEKHIAAWKKEA
ncbi:MAG: glycosyltransferase family 1 protein [Clostridia bacterium]|nr:glycosyltransferase family 1 protein [Clostridia bacterium]